MCYTTSFVPIFQRFLAFSLEFHRRGGRVFYPKRLGPVLALLSFFDMCGDHRQNFLLILLHGFKSVALLVEQIYQVREDFVRLRRR